MSVRGSEAVEEIVPPVPTSATRGFFVAAAALAVGATARWPALRPVMLPPVDDDRCWCSLPKRCAHADDCRVPLEWRWVRIAAAGARLSESAAAAAFSAPQPKAEPITTVAHTAGPVLLYRYFCMAVRRPYIDTWVRPGLISCMIIRGRDYMKSI
jgi:hypothetical protein